MSKATSIKQVVYSVYCYNQEGELVHLFRSELEHNAKEFGASMESLFETHLIESIV